MSATDIPWTDACNQRLTTLWAEGHSAAEIARRMLRTKNSIVGRAHRMKLPARPSPIKAATGNVAPPKRAPKLTLVVDNAVAPEAAPVVREPAKKPCCWPIDIPGSRKFAFCGEQAQVGKPYCSIHSERAYVRTPGQRASV